MLQVVLLLKPVMSAADSDSAFEIVRAELVQRADAATAPAAAQRTMIFSEWDAFGRKGTASHAAASLTSSLINYLDSGIWAMFVFLFGVMALFVVVCLVCICGCDMWSDDYERAQHGKARDGKRRGRDVESGKERTKARGRFKTPEELGLLGRGRVVGVGKSD